LIDSTQLLRKTGEIAGFDQLQAYDPPGNLPDFDGIPGQREQWSNAVAAWFDYAIRRQRKALQKQPCQYFNRLTHPPKGPVVVQEIVWNAFPGTLRTRWGRDQALLLADHVLPLSLKMDKTAEWFRGGVWSDLYYRPQDEYCEWRVTRDEEGRIVRVVFTSEPPEFWQALHGDTLSADDEGEPTLPFKGDPTHLLELYRHYVDERVQLEDLRCPVDLWNEGDPRPMYRKGEYNPYNRWNTTDGIMHLTHPANTLSAEITLGADATILRGRDGRLVADPDVLIACAGYGGNNRTSDPTIGASVNQLAAQGFGITLANPVGLYMDHLDITGWTTETGEPIDKEWFTIVRGQPGLIERATFEAPPGEKRTVSDLSIGGVPIRFGGQLAEHMTVKLVGVADVGATFANSPTGFPYQATAATDNPLLLGSRDINDDLPFGQTPVFQYAEAISSMRLLPERDAVPPAPSRKGTRAW
jgi:hypothetical protein